MRANSAPSAKLVSGSENRCLRALMGESPPSMPAKRPSLCVNSLLLAHVLTIAAFQFAENDGRQNREHPKNQQRLVNAVNHFRRIGTNTRNEKRRRQARRCDA